jgi:hypothetical protein
VISKYRNKKTTYDGITFDSRKEAIIYSQLKRDQVEGRISELKCQIPFEFPVNGEAIRYVDSKRKLKYVLDFKYTDAQGVEHFVDVKGFKTRDYLIKKALMKAVHGIVIEEV